MPCTLNSNSFTSMISSITSHKTSCNGISISGLEHMINWNPFVPCFLLDNKLQTLNCLYQGGNRVRASHLCSCFLSWGEKKSARELQWVSYLRAAGDKDGELRSKRLKRSLIFQETTLHNNKIFHCYVHSGSLCPFPLAGSEGHLGVASKYFPVLCKTGPPACGCVCFTKLDFCLFMLINCVI